MTMFGSGGGGGFSFGQTTTSTPSLSSGLGFGQTATTGAATAGFSFGQPNNTQTTASTGGFSFGQPAPAASTGTTGGFSFGQPAATTSASGFSFGQQSAPATGLTLGQPVASTGGFSFGKPNPATTTSAAGGFSFGQTTATAPTTGGLFGQAAPAASGGFGLNLTATATTSTGTTTTATGFGGLFSTPTAASSASNTLLGGGFKLGATTTTPATGYGIGGATTTPQATGGFSFLGGTATSSAAPTLGLGGSAPSITASTPSLGLGGTQPLTSTGSTIAGIQTDGKSAKETPLPPEIFATLAEFETFKESEKAASESNLRQTAAPFHKLGDDAAKLRQHVLQLSNKHSQLQAGTNKLKSKVMENVENVKMARRTQETPMAQQGDNKAPEQYFLQLVRSFEDRMRFCRSKIEEVENCNKANNGQNVSAADIKDVLRREHETLKILAAKVYSLHNNLIERCHQLNTPSETRPKALFKPRNTNEDSLGQRSTNPSSVLRPLLGDGGSGLMNFQAGQQKAKSMSLGAPPPTIPLGLSNNTSLLGGMNQSSLFNTTNNNSLWNNKNNTNNNTGFKFNTGTGFGLGSSFGASPANTSGLGFGNANTSLTNNSSLFGSPMAKPFGS